MNTLKDIYFTASHIGVKLFILNLYWLFFILIGGVVFGISPATYALYRIMGDERQDEHLSIIELFQKFYLYYKKYFVFSNKLLLPAIVFQVILFLDMNVLQKFYFLQFDGLVFNILKWINFLFVLLVLNILWFAQRDYNIKVIYYKSFILFLGRPSITFMNFLLCLIFFCLYYLNIGIVIVFGTSLFVYIQNKFFLNQSITINI